MKNEDEDEHADTLPPEAPGTDAVSRFFDLFDAFGDIVSDLKKPDPTGRPAEVWIRWRKVEGGVEITSCTVSQLPVALADGEHEGRFR